MFNKHQIIDALFMASFALQANAALAAGMGGQDARPVHIAQVQAAPKSGIDRAYVDPGIRPQDDFYDYLNGEWLKKVPIPADKANWDIFAMLDDSSLPRLRVLIDKAAASHPAAGTDERRIADFYASFMDPGVDRRGMTPLQPELERIRAIRTKAELPELLAHFAAIGVKLPLALTVHLDEKNSTAYIADIGQGGLSLPDRDYYLQTADARLAGMKAGYLTHLQAILGLTGDADANQHARGVLDLETALAEAQWSRVELRDTVKAYNKFAIGELDKVAPGFDWQAWLRAAGATPASSHVMVSQPSYLKAFAAIAAYTPVATWQAYLTAHLVDAYADFLSQGLIDEHFAFYDKTLHDQVEPQPRWKHAVSTIDRSMGEALGRLYVQAYFPPQSKLRMEALVRNLIAAYRQRLAELDWMSPATKREAQAKLAKLTVKVGYPDKWRDYSTLVVRRDDLVGNVMRARAFEFHRQLNKLGKPIDRGEWLMTPQRGDAYNEAELNEIVFPAGILQPPFFDPQADDAVNYGSIGAAIGHEISHGFDDQGARYDGDGNLRNWWSAADHARFDGKTRALIAQYDKFEPLKGYHVNGALTLGENIADNAGLSVAFKAYQISLDGKASPVIDNLSGEQRFYLGWTQVFRGKRREAYEIASLKGDPHAPGKYRVNGALPNQPGFYEAFGVKPGDLMYLPPAERVILW